MERYIGITQMLSPDQAAYVKQKKLIRLQGYGVDALYRTQWGARTVADAMTMETVQSNYHTKVAADRAKEKPQSIVVSNELMIRHLRCVDEYGCGLLEDH